MLKLTQGWKSHQQHPDHNKNRQQKTKYRNKSFVVQCIYPFKLYLWIYLSVPLTLYLVTFTVNAIKIGFAVYTGDKKINDLPERALERGASYAILIYENQNSKPVVNYDKS